MTTPLLSLPRRTITVDSSADAGALELWRHTLGHGGINAHPLPPRIADGITRLRPRLIRIFIQEFFRVCPTVGQLDWSRLDPYMDALAATGAKIVAAITIKPPALFPKIDQSIWQPSDPKAYQNVLAEMVQRYSVRKPIVSHWEIGNEPDIGEWGGCPYLITDPRVYAEYYRMTIEPILKAFPAAKVGGPALAKADGPYIRTLADYCREHRLPLDFVSWHLYHDDPQQHAALVQQMRQALNGLAGPRPELFVTEWSKGFDPISLEELAFEPRRAAITAASIFSMLDAGLDFSFYYHIWDQVAYTQDFAPFFANPRIMTEHWNEIPHRFGLFGVNQEVRPQYFVYQLLSRMGERRLTAQCDDPSLRILASRSPNRLSLMLVNHDRQQSQDLVATLRLSHLTPGRKMLTVHRIDARRAWLPDRLDLLPSERREVDTEPDFRCQLHCPADSVALVELADMA